MNKGIIEHLNVSIDEVKDKQCIVSVTIQDIHKQPFGYVHGGLYVLLAETAASVGAHHLVKDFANVFGLEINANHIKAKSEGRLITTAQCLHNGKTTQVWSVSTKDENDELISTSRCTMYVKHN